MKKLFLYTIITLAVLSFWFGESRHFYCLDNRCITVWKTFNDVCYIVPGKYYGLLKPSGSFIRTTNTNLLSIFFSKQMPKTLFVKNEYEIKIFKGEVDGWVFVDYNGSQPKYDSLFYKPNAKKFNDLKAEADFIELNVQENYAFNKNGKRL
jgi:hypothetical protein